MNERSTISAGDERDSVWVNVVLWCIVGKTLTRRPLAWLITLTLTFMGATLQLTIITIYCTKQLLSRLTCSCTRLWVPGPRLYVQKRKAQPHNWLVDVGKWWSNNNDQDITDQWSPIDDSAINTRQRLVNKALQTLIIRPKNNHKIKTRLCKNESWNI